LKKEKGGEQGVRKHIERVIRESRPIAADADAPIQDSLKSFPADPGINFTVVYID
jgi:hypothetical protein